MEEQNKNQQFSYGKQLFYSIIGVLILAALLSWPMSVSWNYGIKEVFQKLPEVSIYQMYFSNIFIMLFRFVCR
jgi:hypothetical protein